MSMKDTYVQKLEAQLREWEADIDKMKAKADQAEADLQARYEEQIKDLQERRHAARQKLDELREASDSAWEDLKAGTEMARDAFGEAVRSALARFR